MIAFQELHSNTEKSSLYDFLQIKKDEHWQSQNLEKYWHTARIFQSVTHLIIDKRIFVNDLCNVRVILINFITKKLKTVENFEVWINDNLHLSEVDAISQSILKLSQSLLNENRIVFFRTLPKYLANSFQKISSNLQMSIPFWIKVNNFYFNFHVEPFRSYLVEGFELRHIPTENVQTVIENWKYGVVEDKDWIQSSTENFPSLGIWDISTNEMIGQFIYMITGTFGSLTISEKYRGLGLAKMLVLGVLNVIKQQNMEILIEIEDGNVASKCLFEKLHFEKATESIYLVFDNIGNTPIPGKDF